MALYYDGAGRMRERKPSLLRGLRATGIVLQFIALVAVVVTLPLWGHFVPKKAH